MTKFIEGQEEPYLIECLNRTRIGILKSCVRNQLEDPSSQLEDASAIIDILRRPSAYKWRDLSLAAWLLGVAPLPKHRVPIATDVLIRLVARGPVLNLRGYVLKCFDRFHGSLAFLTYWILMLNYDQARRFYDSKEDLVGAVAARSLGRLGASNAIAALATASLRPSQAIRSCARAALVSLMQQVPPEFSTPVRLGAVRDLRRLIGDPNDELVVAVLRALQSLGDLDSLSLVRFLAARGRNRRIRIVAASVLGPMTERLEREASSQTLLRPASCARDGNLLHPDAQSRQALREHLVRSSSDPTKP